MIWIHSSRAETSGASSRTGRVRGRSRGAPTRPSERRPEEHDRRRTADRPSRGRAEDWPGGPRTLTPRDPGIEPNEQTFWFGAELDPDGAQAWFRIASEAVRRMKE